jgi:arylsulfatase A-like enzyme
MRSPDLIYVIADQWRASACGYAGNPEVHTPRLDAFAAQAVNLHHAVSATPVCTPARASLLTGLLPHHHRLVCNDAPLDPALPSFGKAFAAAGYDTAWVGKWHVDGHGRKGYIPPERRQGFTHFAVLECTHAYNKSPYYLNDDPAIQHWDGYDAEAQTQHACEWLRSRDPQQPCCLVLSWGPPHSPYQTAPKADRARYNADELTVPNNVPAARRADAARDLAGYYAHCTALDRCFGILLDTLDDLGRGRDAIIVFTSDHGDFIGAHGLWDKQGPWEESIRIPCLVRGPGLSAGCNDTILNHADHVPTLAALCGVPFAEGLDGRDLSAHVRAGTEPANNSSLIAAYHTFGNWPRIAAPLDPLYHARCYRGLRTLKYTYCEDHQGPWLLYDLDTDPLQMNNRAGDPAYAPVQAQLHTQLHQHLDQVGDEFLADGGYVQRFGYGIGAGETLATKD